MKFALCLHGLVGNIVGKSGDSNIGSETVLKIAHEHWDRYFIEPYKPDIYIHSWNVELQDQIKTLFKPRYAVFEQQKKFNIPDWIPGSEQRKQNHYSKWYSNEQAVQLMSRGERKNRKEYDLVMIARFDIAWRKRIELKKLNKNNFYIGGWHRNPSSKVKDFWFLGSSEKIKKFSTLFQYIEKYSKSGIVSKSNGISNHKLAAKHILNLGFNIEQLLYCHDDFDGNKSDYPLIRYYYFGAQK